MLRQSIRLTGLLVATLVILIGGCKDDDNPVAPGPTTGTIEIDVSPDSIDPPWTLTGPDGYNTSGAGDQTLSDLKTGDYTLTWGEVVGWVTPLIDTQALAAGATVTFSGTYSQDPGPAGGFLQIPAGSFTMGSPPVEPGHNSDEYQHTVTLTTPFLMLFTEVTNQQYADLAQWAFDNGYCTATSSSLLDALDGSILELMGLDDFNCKISFSGGTFTADAGMEDHPVQNVTWYGAVAYCDWLSLQTGLSRAYDHNTWQCNGNDPYHAQGYRLPTEAEWEYACRAGSGTAFANGEIVDTGCNDPVLDEIGWYCGNSNDLTHPVGQLIANDFGLYDMHGNLWDWCNDWYAPYDGDETDPVGGSSPPAGQRVVRGGMWGTNAANCRSANRAGYSPDFSTDGYNINRLSFRPVRSTN